MAKIIGIVLLLLGIGGLLLGDRLLFNSLNIDVAEDIIHILSGGLLFYAGTKSQSAARSMLGVLGMVFLLVGIVGWFAPNLGGMLPHGYTAFDNVVHMVLGIASIGLAATSSSQMTKSALS